MFISIHFLVPIMLLSRKIKYTTTRTQSSTPEVMDNYFKVSEVGGCGTAMRLVCALLLHLVGYLQEKGRKSYMKQEEEAVFYLAVERNCPVYFVQGKLSPAKAHDTVLGS